MQAAVKSGAKKSVVVGCVSAALLVAILCTGLHRNEPSYNGRSLHSWLLDLDEENNPKEVQDQARIAVRQIGTNALPFLIRCISFDEPAWQRRADKLLAGTRFKNVFERRARRFEDCGSDGFKALGPIALPALPDLRILSVDEGKIFNASWAMGEIGIEALPTLVSNLTNGNPDIRLAAIQGIGTMGTNAPASSQTFLVSLTRDTDPYVRGDAYRALVQVARSPEIVSILVQGLHDTHYWVRTCATMAIGWFGTEARWALPELKRSLSDPSELVVDCARRSIQMLDPTAKPELAQ